MKKTTIKEASRQIFKDPREGTFRREDLIDIVMRSGLGTWKTWFDYPFRLLLQSNQ